jgi:steroid 5-alpha reductase family enzyme
MPFAALLPVLGVIYALQGIFAAVFVPLRTEKYYDLCGAVSFIAAVLTSLLGPSITQLQEQWTGFGKGSLNSILSLNFHPRQLLLSGLTILWAVRLGSFLFSRLSGPHKGKDFRFDNIRNIPWKFFGAWMGQATWIALTAMPVYMTNTIHPDSQPSLNWLDSLGLGLWVVGFLMEAEADRQKNKWRQDKINKKHHEEFIHTGLWSVSRHPNYVGEVILQTGSLLISASALLGYNTIFPRSGIILAMFGPIFEYILLRFFTGVPTLEDTTMKPSGPAWNDYCRRVPVFFPRAL